MVNEKNEGPTARPCPSEPVQKSFRYTKRGERVDACGGTYWIPAREFSGVVAAARRDPAVLNRYPFVPAGACRKNS